MKSFYFSSINLWCSKNLVDLEFLIWTIFQKKSKEIDIKFFDTPENKEVEYIIINTCWFLSSSRKEAENLIKEYDDMWKKIIVMWCYTEVKDDEFLSKLKNLFAIIPHNDSKNLNLIFKSKIQKLKKDFKKNSEKKDNLKEYLKNIWWNNLSKKAFLWEWTDIRAYFNTDFGYEYLKISEWCDNNCTFCIIPSIRWRQKSRKIEDILVEIKNMVWIWIKEIQIIAQDTTRYWTDLYWKPSLIKLLSEIEKLPLNFKYRLYYLYPDNLSLENLKQMTKFKKMLPYFDIPFQHISPKILKLMWRFYNEDDIYNFLDFIKSNFKNAFLHTNFIVWFPGEDENDFNKLKEFIKKYEFDSISMFWYHDEKLATSSKLKDKVPNKIIIERLQILKEIIENIYDKKFEKRKKQIQTWYIHEIWKTKVIIRPEIHAPEIDDLDIINIKDIISWNIKIWEKVKYKIIN